MVKVNGGPRTTDNACRKIMWEMRIQQSEERRGDFSNYGARFKGKEEKWGDNR